MRFLCAFFCSPAFVSAIVIGMALLQASMSRFLYESRVSDEVAGGVGSDGAAVNVECVAGASSDQTASVDQSPPVLANSS